MRETVNLENYLDLMITTRSRAVHRSTSTLDIRLTRDGKRFVFEPHDEFVIVDYMRTTRSNKIRIHVRMPQKWQMRMSTVTLWSRENKS